MKENKKKTKQKTSKCNERKLMKSKNERKWDKFFLQEIYFCCVKLKKLLQLKHRNKKRKERKTIEKKEKRAERANKEEKRENRNRK